MLEEASRWLIDRSDFTLVVARHASGVDYANDGVRLIDADWNAENFSQTVRDALATCGPIGTALLWLHDPKPILSWLVPLLPGTRIVVVLGSMDGRPERIASPDRLVFVQLGSVLDNGRRRWLTHAEISQGAIGAMRSGESVVVGHLRGLSGG